MDKKKVIKYGVVAFLFGGIPLAALVWRAIQLQQEGQLFARTGILVAYLAVGVLAYRAFARDRY
jgi:hypothetical protein